MNSNRDLTNVTGYIYKITSPFGDVYIGQTISVKDRKYAYKSGYFTKQTKLWRNCQKYNWNPSETFEVIDECLCGSNKELINEKEIYWINFFDTKDNGLNCTEGGKGQVGKIWSDIEKENQSKLIQEMYNNGLIDLSDRVFPKLTEEHKNNISKSSKEYFKNNEHWNKDKITSQEVKEKISNSVSGERNGFYGKKHTEESIAKIKIARSKQVISEETRKKMSESSHRKYYPHKYGKSVCQYDLEGNFIEKYESIKEASIKTGCSSSKIVVVCKGDRKSTNNFIWKYENNI